MDIKKIQNLSVKNYSYKSWTETFPDFKVSLENLTIDESWKNFFNNQKKEQWFSKLEKYLTHSLTLTKGTVNIFPYPDLLLTSFNVTPFNKIKVLILGQDPYFNAETENDKLIPQAMGLSFSVPNGITIPSSLKNIFANLKEYKHITEIPTHGNLTKWATQGCMLLNTALTVQQGHPNSHAKFWLAFTDEVIKQISKNTDNTVFVLWGAPALSKLEFIDQDKHKVIISSHPSGQSNSKPLRTYPAFSKNDHFGQINSYLKEHKKTEIDWKL